MSNPNGFFTNNGVKLTLKIFFIGFIGILMLLATGIVQSVVSERESYKSEATSSISNSWGGKQTITPPILTIPVKSVYKNPKDKSISTSFSYFHFLPDKLNIVGDIKPEVRYKGIFKKVVYTANLQINGNFAVPQVSKASTDEQVYILWNEAFIATGISDTKGIQGEPSILVGDKKAYFQPGSNKQSLFNSGMNAKLDYNSLKDKSNPFSLQLNIKGSDDLNFIPTGKNTKVKLSSSWIDPSFDGSFLPSKKVVSEKGFQAEWDISYLARNFPQSWINNLDEAGSFNNSSFGASLLTPVDFYRNTLRAIKYAILFIALTFLTFFMFEVIAKLKIHAFQYFLIGVAVSLFYLILLSLSEFIGFNAAYILASIANITLISLYTKAIAKNAKHILTWFMVGVLIFLYSFLYVLLQLQDLSLLIGSIGLFVVLAAVMFFTRNIDWFEGKITTDN
jgi:inner membrane protein